MKRNYDRALVRKSTGICAAIALALGAGSAAAEEATSYHVAAIKDSAYGRLILKDDFGAAIDKLEDRDRKGIDGFYTATNLCVAFIKTGELERAESSCSLAVDEIEKVLANELRYDSAAELNAIRKFHALALSNRGVAYAVNGDHDLAQADFEAADEIESRLKEPALNLALLASAATPGG